MTKKRKLGISALLLGVAGLALLAYEWYILGERGLAADANGTSGDMTSGDILTMFAGAVCLAASIIAIRLYNRHIHSQQQ